MCDKLPYCNPRKDKCLIQIIRRINNYSPFRTVASCCGHGKYEPTIIIKTKANEIFELFSRTKLEEKKRNRYYKRDDDGHYYIPEVVKVHDKNVKNQIFN